MNATLRAIGTAAVAAFVAAAGCSNQKLKPGVTYEATVIARGDDGRPTPQGQPIRVESVLVQDTREIALEGGAVSLLVRKTEHEKATFDVTFPDNTSQMVRIKTGESKDVLPKGQKTGIRIEVIDCR
jgi:hypothetical protein